MDDQVKYIGPLSRFASSEGTPKELRRNSEETPKPYHAPVAENTEYSVVAILSGLEPQRSIFEWAILERYANTSEKVLLVRGKVAEAQTKISRNNITIVASLSDQALLDAMEQEDVKAAFAAAQDGDTVELQADIELTETLKNTKKITLDLNGKTITGKPCPIHQDFSLLYLPTTELAEVF